MHSIVSRHYELCHSEELIVMKLSDLEKEKRVERKKVSESQIMRDEIFSFLRKKAIAKYNMQADINSIF